MSFEQLAVFILKRLDAVMFPLAGDVFADSFDIRFGDRERAIA